MLDKEATDAERLLSKPKSYMHERQICDTEYVNSMKIFIFYLHYGVRPKGLNPEDLSLFDTVCEKNQIWEMH
jgi:hypothetical protein